MPPVARTGFVVSIDNRGWSLYGAQRSQPVATSGKCDSAEIGSDRRKPLRWVANGKECHEEGPPAESCSARPRETKGGPTQCCTPVWISVASASTSTCSTRRRDGRGRRLAT